MDERIEAILSAKRAAAAAHLKQMRDHLAALGEQEALRCTDASLLRFLESEVTLKGTEVKAVRVPSAARNLLATLKWRKSYGLESPGPPLRTTPCCPGCEENAYSHCFFSIGVDKRGWEVFYACPGRSHGKNPDALVRHSILSLESVFEGPFEVHPRDMPNMDMPNTARDMPNTASTTAGAAAAAAAAAAASNGGLLVADERPLMAPLGGAEASHATSGAPDDEPLTVMAKVLLTPRRRERQQHVLAASSVEVRRRLRRRLRLTDGV